MIFRGGSHDKAKKYKTLAHFPDADCAQLDKKSTKFQETAAT
jgi:hypothetical protein